MHLLLVNDDGIDSPLLHLLSRTAAARGHRVTVAAPMTQQSAKSHAFTVFSPVRAERRPVPGAEEAWAVEGTPVDCTRLGLYALCEEKPDAVISGINNGWNTGLATFVSGTVGAAREAAFVQGRAVAASIAPDAPEDTAGWLAQYAVETAERLPGMELPPQCVVNINAPAVPLGELKPPVRCPIGRTVYQDTYERFVSPRGDTWYFLLPESPVPETDPEADVSLLRRGHVTVSWLTP